MVRLAPFTALRYDPALAGPPAETSAPPYDDLDPVSYAAHRTSNPYTVLELLAGDGDPAGGHAAGRATLDRWLRTGVLVPDARPALHLYEQRWQGPGGPRVQRGWVGAVDLGDLDAGRVLLHERVEPSRVARRVERLAGIPLDVTPCVALHLGGGGAEMAHVEDELRRAAPEAAFRDEAGVAHRLWRLEDRDAIAAVAAAAAPVQAVVADGHHRLAAARELRTARAGAGQPTLGWGHTTAWLVDADRAGPDLLAVHRLVDAALPEAADGGPAVDGFRTTPWRGTAEDLADAVAAQRTPAIGVVTADGRWLLEARQPAALRGAASRRVGPVLGSLDAALVEEVVLRPLGDVPVHPVFDVDLVDRALHAGRRTGTLLLLRPPSVEQVLQVARAGERMPAKTTWFRPKPRAGLLLRHLDHAVPPPAGPLR